MVDAATLTNATPIIEKSDSGGTRDSVARLAENFDSFLKLLTTQLQHQDPTDPLETAEFTNQLVQFASVEQEVSTNEKLDELIDGQKQSNPAVNYLGKEVESNGTSAELANGKANFNYELSGPADKLDIGISDQFGQLVHAYSLEGDYRGRQTLEWDGKDFAGNDFPDGTYNMNVRATFAGREVSVQTYSRGKVTGVDFAGDEAVLIVGGQRIPVGQVHAVYEPKPEETV